MTIHISKVLDGLVDQIICCEQEVQPDEQASEKGRALSEETFSPCLQYFPFKQ